MRNYNRRTKKLRSLIYRYIARAEERKTVGDRRCREDWRRADQLMDQLRKLGCI